MESSRRCTDWSLDSLKLTVAFLSYDLAWTFPRSFHVSPFNSRDGYYRLDLVNPFRSSCMTPVVKVALRVLKPDQETKLWAVLSSDSKRPAILLDTADSLALARTILSFPLALLMTTPRILYQAYTLHYAKNMLVYPRPPPRVTGDEKEWNPTQIDEEGVGSGLRWKRQSWTEKKAMAVFARCARRSAARSGILLEIVFLDQRPIFRMGDSDHSKRKLVIKTADASIFTNLLSAPSAHHFLLLAPELLTTISCPELFEEFYVSSSMKPDLFDSATSTVRDWHIRWFMSNSRVEPKLDLSLEQRSRIWPCLGLGGFLVVSASYIADILDKKISNLIGTNYVEGREPWKLWERALGRQYSKDACEQSREDSECRQRVLDPAKELGRAEIAHDASLDHY